MPSPRAFQINAFQKNAFQVAEVTSTAALQKPVDYALAGEQDYKQGRQLVRSGRVSGRMARHIFNE